MLEVWDIFKDMKQIILWHFITNFKDKRTANVIIYWMLLVTEFSLTGTIMLLISGSFFSNLYWNPLLLLCTLLCFFLQIMQESISLFMFMLQMKEHSDGLEETINKWGSNILREILLGRATGFTPVRRADNLTTFMCRLSWNLGASNSWNTQGLSRPVMGLLFTGLTKIVSVFSDFVVHTFHSSQEYHIHNTLGCVWYVS